MENYISSIKECIDSFFGCDSLYFGVDGFSLAEHLFHQGFVKQDILLKDIFKLLEDEIRSALLSNYKVRAEHIFKHPDDLDSSLLSLITGKINALRGILDFIEDLRPKYFLSEK